MGADVYLTGDAAANYLDMRAFDEHGVRVHFHEYHHPEYEQLHGPFIPFLSVIDLLFNCGPDSLSILSRPLETTSWKRFSSQAAPDLSAATL